MWFTCTSVHCEGIDSCTLLCCQYGVLLDRNIWGGGWEGKLRERKHKRTNVRGGRRTGLCEAQPLNSGDFTQRIPRRCFTLALSLLRLLTHGCNTSSVRPVTRLVCKKREATIRSVEPRSGLIQHVTIDKRCKVGIAKTLQIAWRLKKTANSRQ